MRAASRTAAWFLAVKRAGSRSEYRHALAFELACVKKQPLTDPGDPMHGHLAQFQISRDASTIRASLRRWSSVVTVFPSQVLAKPHWGLKASCSSGVNRPA
jgi:hypothetical protein